LGSDSRDGSRKIDGGLFSVNLTRWTYAIERGDGEKANGFIKYVHMIIIMADTSS
jgi:hypothetical protein